ASSAGFARVCAWFVVACVVPVGIVKVAVAACPQASFVTVPRARVHGSCTCVVPCHRSWRAACPRHSARASFLAAYCPCRAVHHSWRVHVVDRSWRASIARASWPSAWGVADLSWRVIGHAARLMPKSSVMH
ncbi:hypothetical protein NL676_007210, partial [Syzygium grande]